MPTLFNPRVLRTANSKILVSIDTRSRLYSSISDKINNISIDTRSRLYSSISDKTNNIKIIMLRTIPKNSPVNLDLDKLPKTGNSIVIGYTPSYYTMLDASLVILN